MGTYYIAGHIGGEPIDEDEDMVEDKCAGARAGRATPLALLQWMRERSSGGGGGVPKRRAGLLEVTALDGRAGLSQPRTQRPPGSAGRPARARRARRRPPLHPARRARGPRAAAPLANPRPLPRTRHGQDV
jgi:hypothetical protein